MLKLQNLRQPLNRNRTKSNDSSFEEKPEEIN